MRNSRIAVFSVLMLIGATFAGSALLGQSGSATPVWEALLRASLPADSMAKISLFTMPVSAGWPSVRQPGAGHTHAGPVFAYILQGEIENQVEPDPPQQYSAGEFFYEIPGHVHRYLWNLSATQPAQLIIFQAGDPGKPAPVIKTLLDAPLGSVSEQEVGLFRLTLPPGAFAERRALTNPGFIYPLEGTIETAGTPDSPRTFGAGEPFAVRPGSGALKLRNVSKTEPAKLLFYSVHQKGMLDSAQ